MKVQLPQRTFETMNGLRGLAALMVVLWHGGDNWYGKFVPPGGYLAVDLFFVLSGFVIAHAYHGRLAAGMAMRQFFVIRLIRLYPLYMLGTLATCVIGLAYSILHQNLGGTFLIGLRTLPFALLMLPAPSGITGDLNADLYPLNVPAWSLFCEMVVNLVYAATYKLWSVRNMTVLMTFSAILILSCEDLYKVPQGWGAGGFNWATMPFGFFRVFYSFPAGVMVYRLVIEKQFSLPRIGSLIVLAVFPFFLIWHTGWSSQIIMFFGFPALVALASLSEPTGAVKWLCASLGKASYAIYAIHFALIGLTAAIQTKYGFDPNKQFIGWLFLASIVPLALLIDRSFDGPVRKFLNARFVAPSLTGKGDLSPRSV
jgi:peptidoglycan/LPS O-acetylase OafA/YrhL